ncbi:MAG TPA: hypothetical protein VHO25_12665, partial [Polyangiaceae bacterium]|nr:hypothetical protein [Polyangiaceae bacterium]
MRALHRKLLRDLYRLKGQVLTIALVVACGIGSYIALRGNYTSLQNARSAFYARQRFADIFVRLERAPRTLLPALETIPGVERVDTRVVEPALLPIEDISEPVRATVMSLPDHESLNAIHLHDGRRPEPGHNDEVVVLRGFAQAHHYAPGDRIPAVINGKKRTLRVVGTATSPEYVIGITGGAVTADPSRFAVLWMNTEAVAAAYRMESSFNSLAVSLGPDGSVPEVLVTLDRILEPYGGTGAFERARQLSHRILDGELQQLRGISTFLPLIFLGVAALLVNVVLS